MTFNEIEKEYWETFDINQGTDKINGYPVIKISDTYSRPATVEDFESFLKQSFIKYLQDEVERLEKTVQKDPYELEIIPEEDKGKITDVMLRNGVKMLKNQDGKEFRWGYNQAISDQITYITNQIKELEV